MILNIYLFNCIAVFFHRKMQYKISQLKLTQSTIYMYDPLLNKFQNLIYM